MPVNLSFIGRTCALLLTCFLVACGGSDSTDTHDDTLDSSNIINRDNPNICNQTNTAINWPALESVRCNSLSDYGLFNGQPNQVNSSTSGIHYQLNSELFSDYARKYRYIYLPKQDSKISYKQDDSLELPVGTVLVKVFALPSISTNHKSENIIEVRLMVQRDNGWIFIPYVWDETTQDGYLAIGGSTAPVRFEHNGEPLEFNYESPTLLRCGNCHQVAKENKLTFLPIGPKIRHLNRTITVDNQEVNQLEHWQSLGLIELPKAAKDLPYAPGWRDTSKSLQDRAKAYLDINCAYCHNPYGAAALSGLRLEYTRKSLDRSHGVCNSSHGWRGGGFDIWPGRGAESSIPKRMGLDGATDRMPPIGRVVSDDEAIDLLIEWIDSMPEVQCSS